VNADGMEIGAVRGVVSSMLALLADGATHVAVATDHVIESWRNDLWATYKDGTGIDPVLFAQFPLLEEALAALGLTVWAMVEDEADDALGTAARVAETDPRVEQVLVCTPDKDLGQVVGGKIVQFDRRKGGTILDADAIRAKFGVDPESIPDYLALVGDTADGFPGIPGWGAKSAAAVLAHYKHIEAVPAAAGQWEVSVRNSPTLASRLAAALPTALLFKRLATLNCDCDVGTVDDWHWAGPTAAFAELCERLDAPDYPSRAERLAAARR
jgi:5'-3' exonuclease